jgi:hypothetical protein
VPKIDEMERLFCLFQSCEENYRKHLTNARGSKKAYKDFMRELRDIKNSITPIRQAIFDALDNVYEQHETEIAESEMQAIEML